MECTVFQEIYLNLICAKYKNVFGLNLYSLHVHIPHVKFALYFIFLCLFLKVAEYNVVQALQKQTELNGQMVFLPCSLNVL